MLRACRWIAVAAVLAVACTAAPPCDRLLVGAVLELPDGPVRREIAVSGGRIVALVPPEDARRWRRAAAEVVELAGAHVYPGFTESHGHLTGYGAALEVVDLRGAASFTELVEGARAAAERRPAGGWVTGRGEPERGAWSIADPVVGVPGAEAAISLVRVGEADLSSGRCTLCLPEPGPSVPHCTRTCQTGSI